MHVFEPQQDAMNELIKNYGNDERIKINQKALGAKKDTLMLNKTQKSATSTLVAIFHVSSLSYSFDRLHRLQTLPLLQKNFDQKNKTYNESRYFHLDECMLRVDLNQLADVFSLTSLLFQHCQSRTLQYHFHVIRISLFHLWYPMDKTLYFHCRLPPLTFPPSAQVPSHARIRFALCGGSVFVISRIL